MYYFFQDLSERVSLMETMMSFPLSSPTSRWLASLLWWSSTTLMHRMGSSRLILFICFRLWKGRRGREGGRKRGRKGGRNREGSRIKYPEKKR